MDDGKRELNILILDMQSTKIRLDCGFSATPAVRTIQQIHNLATLAGLPWYQQSICLSSNIEKLRTIELDTKWMHLRGLPVFVAIQHVALVLHPQINSNHVTT